MAPVVFQNWAIGAFGQELILPVLVQMPVVHEPFLQLGQLHPRPS